MPLVSVVTCTYNRAHLIGETISSVLNQSLRDLEYIIVDDGSEDDTKSVVESFSDQRIRYFYLPHTGKLSSLRNFSHSRCRGELIAHIDSDDIMVPSRLEMQAAALKANPSATFSFTDIEIFNKDGVIKRGIYGSSGVRVEKVFRRMLENQLVICHTTLMIRRSCLDIVGESDESFLSGDHDFVFRLAFTADAVIFSDPLVSVRKHEGNSSQGEKYALAGFKEHHLTLKKLLDNQNISTDEYQAAYATTSYAFGRQAAGFGNYDSALFYFKESYRMRRFHLRSLFKIGRTLSKKVFGI